MGSFFAVDTDTESHEGARGAISREIVLLLKDLVGRGPTKSRTHVLDDCIVVLLREGHTKGEDTMFAAGGSRGVAQGRVDMSETIREPLIEVVERHVGRRVVGFMSSSQQDPDLIGFIFVLETSPIIEPTDLGDADAEEDG